MKFFNFSKTKNGSIDSFQNFINKSDLCVKALEDNCLYAIEYVLKSNNRIDCLQLFSPNFNSKNRLEIKNKLKTIMKKNINIEIFLRISDLKQYKNIVYFFKPYATIYTIKG